MSCGCNNNGWGGCGCQGTVQYAPPACNPNFPTTCTALGAGTIQRVVGEDSSYCKYTVPTLQSNSILFYNASTALVTWADSSVANPIFLGSNSASQATATSGQIQALTPTGQLVGFKPSTSTEAQFPVVSPSGTTTTWGTVESILPNQGIVYKTGSVADGLLSANTVYQLTGASGQYVSFDALGNPVAVASTSSISYIYKNGNYQAIAGQSIAADTTAGGWTLTLPANPQFGTICNVVDASGTWTANNLTVAPYSGSTLLGSNQNLIANQSYRSVTFYFNNITWVPIIS